MPSKQSKPLAIPPELDAEMTPAVRLFVLSLLQRIEDLERQLAEKTPQNSSKPPSTQHPHAKPPPQRRKSKRKRGGQPGHKKHERPLKPTDECDEVYALRPCQCRRCGHALCGDDPAPLRHQVWELPEIRPVVTEYQRHRLTCSECGEQTCAELPPGVPAGQSGPRLIAFTAMLMAHFRQSKRRTAQFLSTLLNCPCSPSLTVKLQQIATAAARPGYEEVVRKLPGQTAVNADETPMKEAHRKTWLWTFVAKRMTVFAVRQTREATAVDELLTDQFTGVVMCDRAKMYWRVGRLQWCWEHLKRDFQALIDRGDNQARRLGYDLRRCVRDVFRHWAAYRDGDISRAALQRRIAPVRRAVEGYLHRGIASENKSLVGMCHELYGHREWLWEFVRTEGVEPTNNAGERALRHAVIWRKLSFGTQSAQGSRFVETMLTLIETCRQQGRLAFEHLVQSVQAHLSGQIAPSLLPST